LKALVIISNARQAVYIGGLYLQNNAESVAEIVAKAGGKHRARRHMRKKKG